MKDHSEFIAKLRKARAHIKRGWTQGTSYVLVGRVEHVCLLQALGRAGIRDGQMVSVWPDGGGASLLDWNDTPGRTQAEVLACLDNSIAALS